MKADVASIVAASGFTLGVAGLFYMVLNWNDLIDECFDDWGADCRTEDLVNDLFHNGTDSTRRRNDHATR